MPLAIETFNNQTGGNSFFKAIGHPLVAERVRAWIADIGTADSVAIIDPHGHLSDIAELYDLSAWAVRDLYVQRMEDLGREAFGLTAKPLTDLSQSKAECVVVAAFDAARLLDQLKSLIGEGPKVFTLDDVRLPDDMLTNKRRYLDLLNFATNYVLFRDTDDLHTTLRSTNYWHGYGAAKSDLWCCLLDEDGAALADWRDALPERGGSFKIDSSDVRRRFNLGPFTGSLFVHAIGTAAHDIMKYALDIYGDTSGAVSCTHDANGWPSDYYAGLPAPDDGERVTLWLQNSHPKCIPAGAIGLNLMGHDEIAWHDEEIPPFATRAIDVSDLLPNVRWPAQIEIQAGKYFVRPRYEVVTGEGDRRLAHANVERGDLEPDPNIAELGAPMGKGFILPAPILPVDQWQSLVLPTPMARGQHELPLKLLVYDASGEEMLAKSLGNLARTDSAAIDVTAVLEESSAKLPSGHGHFELAYDFDAGQSADGWLHGLFRYQRKDSIHGAETSFGSHIYNVPVTYKNEPQSYAGRAPGLSTRLFLRLGEAPDDTLCHLIYPASATWHPQSRTSLILHEAGGSEVTTREIEIPLNGSRLWRYSEIFNAETRARAGEGAYIIVRDATCRLFGYHGILAENGGFSFDHMFGF